MGIKTIYKQQILEQMQAQIASNKEEIQNRTNSLKSDLFNESKSSMGDKYETSRAMLHLELEQQKQLWDTVLKQEKAIHNINFDTNNTTISNGNLVETTNGNYFMSIGLGVFQIEGTTIYCLSPISPIGKHLIGKAIKDVFQFQEKKIQILNII